MSYWSFSVISCSKLSNINSNESLIVKVNLITLGNKAVREVISHPSSGTYDPIWSYLAYHL